MPFDIDALDVIYAEDEEAFRMITTPVLTFAGIDEGNIHIAENGHEALECLKEMQARPDRPLLMLLDVRMPLMDGHTCAAEVKAMADANNLKRVPFVVIYTAGIDKVSKDDGDQNKAVKISMPKPLAKKQLDSVIDSLKNWWEAGRSGSAACVVDIPPMDPRIFDIIVANDEPICSMALIATLNLAGVDDENVLQADTSDEIDETVASVKNEDGRPLLLFLGNESWLSVVNEAITKSGKRVFIVWSSVDTDSKSVTQKGFNGYLPRTYDKTYIIENVLQPCHQWFHSG